MSGAPVPMKPAVGALSQPRPRRSRVSGRPSSVASAISWPLLSSITVVPPVGGASNLPGGRRVLGQRRQDLRLRVRGGLRWRGGSDAGPAGDGTGQPGTGAAHHLDLAPDP